MNKREVVWLIVRLIGVYFAYSAVVTLFTLAGSVSALYSLSSDPNAKTESENVRPVSGFPPTRPDNEPHQAVKSDPATEKLKSEAFKTLLMYIFLTGLYGGIGIYLMAKGRFLFNILNNEVSTARRTEETVTTLKL